MFFLNLNFRFLFLAVFVFSSASAALQRDGDSLINPVENSFSINYSDYFSGISCTRISFRDFATSPLFYDVYALQIQMGWPVVKQHHRREIGFDLTAGVSAARVPQEAEYMVTSPAGFYSGNINYDYLTKIQVPRFKGNIFLGGSVQSRLHFRRNKALGNNGTGIEAFFNFMASGRLEKDFSRKAGEGKSWLLFNRRNSVHRTLAYQLNLGLINFNYRPGYAYGGFSEFDGSNTKGLQFLLDGHSWTLNGFRIQSRLEWIINKKKKYSNRWMYSWELLTAPGKYEKFQFASHTFTYSMLLFRK